MNLLFCQSKPQAQSLKHGAVFCGVRPTASFLSYVGGMTHARLPHNPVHFLKSRWYDSYVFSCENGHCINKYMVYYGI